MNNHEFANVINMLLRRVQQNDNEQAFDALVGPHGLLGRIDVDMLLALPEGLFNGSDVNPEDVIINSVDRARAIIRLYDSPNIDPYGAGFRGDGTCWLNMLFGATPQVVAALAAAGECCPLDHQCRLHNQLCLDSVVYSYGEANHSMAPLQYLRAPGISVESLIEYESVHDFLNNEDITAAERNERQMFMNAVANAIPQ